MLFITMVLLSYVSAFVLYAITNKKKNISSHSIVAYILSGFFFFSVIIIYFFLVKFNGDVSILLFPDERTYLFNTYELGFFDIYIKSIYHLGGIELVRSINIFAFFFGQLIVLNQIRFNGYTIREMLFMIFIIVSLALFSYWTYFVLKEAFTFLGIALYLSYQGTRKNSERVVALIILFVTRLNLFILIIGIELFSRIYYKFKRRALLLVLTAFISVITFINSPISYSYKLGILSRRFGAEVKQFDEAARNTASKGFFSFLFSEEYIQAVLTNLNETFNPVVGDSVFIKIMLLVNLIGFLLIIFYVKPKLNKITIIFYSIILLLIATNSSFRYVNAIILPFCFYFFAHKKKIRGFGLL